MPPIAPRPLNAPPAPALLRAAVCGTLLVLAARSVAVGEPRLPVKILFDSDMDTDCDDAGALGLLHALADLGEAEILATAASTKNRWSPACIAAINAYYGRPGLPLGQPKGAGVDAPSKYARQVAAASPHDVGLGNDVADARDVYRRALLAQPDRSVVIVTVGYLTNIADLLQLPAEGGLPSGRELVERKVLRWVCMGGNFIGDPPQDDLQLSNNNFTRDARSALAAVRNWPGEVVFVGREIGSVPSGLQVGRELRTVPRSHPVRLAYELYFGGEPQDRHVADQTTVLYAVRGLGEFWDLSSVGEMDLQPEMTFRWRPDPAGRQYFLLKRRIDGRPLDREVERAIEALMLRPPGLKPAQPQASGS